MPVDQRFEATLAAPFSVSGRGLHTNRFARVTVAPAPPGHGIRFDVAGAGAVGLSYETRAPSRLNTALRLPDGTTLRTIEHLAASLSAFGVDNALVMVEGREMPIFDGSARDWCAAIVQAGLTTQAAPRRLLRITRPIQVAMGQRFVRAEPAASLELDVTCESYYAGGVQAWRGHPSAKTFAEELAASRSSGQVSRLWDFGPVATRVLAPLLRPIGRRAVAEPAGGPVANAPWPDLPTALTDGIRAGMAHPRGEPVLRGVRLGRAAIQVGPWVLGGARFPDERVRHNALDLLGDLMLAGRPLVGRIVAHRPTHKLTYAFVATLMQSPDAYEVVEA
ncbi:UDP-3-O-acyl-N-acetylglucosamine deacetylase [Methylobacterium sp. C25]|uniref:UDP-3-O-acyl-N-acetylglucosamine deacetylase n=1 Tax=Methylobacterium sp. C25 TaxID=2721622 RepID=UPI001F16863E|nr:UDP-3-O-acyl-N-acetylglucosamine deacetylase [Methylobacterium sp. C25]MCE4224756.1 UDP-3-O-acyl-N-acetylglucosamine deacetylase [Methylobacterium sp. C25]